MEINPTKASKDTYNGATKAVDKFADKLQTGVVEQASDRMQAIESNLASRYEALRDSAAEGYDTAISTVKKYPLYAVLGSTAIGLLAGLLIAKRRS